MRAAVTLEVNFARLVVTATAFLMSAIEERAERVTQPQEGIAEISSLQTCYLMSKVDRYM